MENKTYKVIKCVNGKDYLILRQILYKNDTYYVTTEVKDDLENFDEVLTVLKQTIKDSKTYVNIVNDVNIVQTIMTHIA